jgi:hypothetical protein
LGSLQMRMSIFLTLSRSVQRYEGGSTIYGPSTLDAYIDIYSNLVGYLGDTAAVPSPGTPPPDLTQHPLSLRVSPLVSFSY